MNDGKDAASLRELGNRYREGDGVEKDPSRAAELLSEASDLGDAQAASSLGYMLMVGEGIPADRPAAEAQLRRAADAGIATAMCNLRVRVVVRQGGGGGQPPRRQEPGRGLLLRIRRSPRQGEGGGVLQTGRRPRGRGLHVRPRLHAPQRGRRPHGQAGRRGAIPQSRRPGRLRGSVRPGVHAGRRRGHPAGPRRGREAVQAVRRPGRHRRLPLPGRDPLRERRLRGRRGILHRRRPQGRGQGDVQPGPDVLRGLPRGTRRGEGGGVVRVRRPGGLRIRPDQPRRDHLRQGRRGGGRPVVQEGRRPGDREAMDLLVRAASAGVQEAVELLSRITRG